MEADLSERTVVYIRKPAPDVHVLDEILWQVLFSKYLQTVCESIYFEVYTIGGMMKTATA